MVTETLVRRPQKTVHGNIVDISRGLRERWWLTSRSCHNQGRDFGKTWDLWDLKTVYGLGTHKFSQKTKEMFANFVSKKDHGDRFLGQGGCASGRFPWTWFKNKLWEILWNTEKVKKSDSKQASGKNEFQGFVFSCQCPHTANRTRERLDHFGLEVFDHPPYSPNLAPSDYHLFPNMKTWLSTQFFDDAAELQAGVNEWLKSQAVTFYDDGINKLVHRYDKCLNFNGDYVEK